MLIVVDSGLSELLLILSCVAFRLESLFDATNEKPLKPTGRRLPSIAALGLDAARGLLIIQTVKPTLARSLVLCFQSISHPVPPQIRWVSPVAVFCQIWGIASETVVR